MAKESKSSINFKAVDKNSELHNYRKVPLDYLKKEVLGNFENWSKMTISEMEKESKQYCKAQSGRKLQKNAQIIREGVVNLKSTTTMDDLRKMASMLKNEFGFDIFQIHIHRDEGHYDKDTNELIVNHHAHVVARWQDMETGKVLRLLKLDLSKLQTRVAEILDMERGELKVNSNVQRLEAIEYKVQQEEKRLAELKHKLKNGLEHHNIMKAKINKELNLLDELSINNHKLKFANDELAEKKKESESELVNIEKKAVHYENELNTLKKEENQLQQRTAQKDSVPRKKGFLFGLFRKNQSTSSQKMPLVKQFLSLLKIFNSLKKELIEKDKVNQQGEELLKQFQADIKGYKQMSKSAQENSKGENHEISKERKL